MFNLIEPRKSSDKDLTILLRCPGNNDSKIQADSSQLQRYSAKAQQAQICGKTIAIQVDSQRDVHGWKLLENYLDWDGRRLPDTVEDLVALLGVARQQLVDVCVHDCVAKMVPMCPSVTSSECYLLLTDPTVGSLLDEFEDLAAGIRASMLAHVNRAQHPVAADSEEKLIFDVCKGFVGNLDTMLAAVSGPRMKVFCDVKQEAVFHWLQGRDVDAGSEAAVLRAATYWAASNDAPLAGLLNAVRLPGIAPAIMLVLTGTNPALTERLALEAMVAGMLPDRAELVHGMAKRRVDHWHDPMSIQAQGLYWNEPRDAFTYDAQFEPKVFDLTLDCSAQRSTDCVFHAGLFWDIVMFEDDATGTPSVNVRACVANPLDAETHRVDRVCGTGWIDGLVAGYIMRYSVHIPDWSHTHAGVVDTSKCVESFTDPRCWLRTVNEASPYLEAPWEHGLENIKLTLQLQR